MAEAITWRGRRGTVLLGPTQNRVARYLEARTRHGRVRIRTVDLAGELGLERSEAYRITGRLRVLGLFGVQDDRGGTIGGRLWWRTAIAHDGQVLDAGRHREAWRRILGWARARVGAWLALASANQQDGRPPVPDARPRDSAVQRDVAPGPARAPSARAGPTFEDRMRRAGMGGLIDEWQRRDRG